MVVQRMRRHLQLDWVRCDTDVRTLSLACCSWFRGRDPALSVEEFVARWGPPGLLCTVVVAGDGSRALTVQLSTSHPVACPVPDPVLALPANLDD